MAIIINKVKEKFASVFSCEEGFTLIELMIVIAIIGILAAVAIPQLTGVRGKANVSAVQSEFKSIQTSMEMYYIDNGKYPNSLSALQTGGYASSEQIQDINNTDYDNAGSIANGGEGKLSNPNGVAVDYKLQYNVPNSGGTIVTLETNNGVTVTN